MMEKIKVVMVDDHLIFRKAIINLTNSFCPKIEIIEGFSGGLDLINYLKQGNKPDLIVIDIEMKGMTGYELAKILQTKFKNIPVLVLSMIDEELSVLRMLKLGVKGFLSKNIDIQDLENAVVDILDKGFHYTDIVTGRLIKILGGAKNEYPLLNLSDRETEFLKLACSDLTYKEIADIMNVSVKSVDAYRAALFEKFNVKSRVGLALFAVRSHF
jgi:DNA-binding NarL/FixJ family response regulator